VANGFAPKHHKTLIFEKIKKKIDVYSIFKFYFLIGENIDVSGYKICKQS